MTTNTSTTTPVYWHATTARLPIGTVLVPGAELGIRNFGDARGASNEWVYIAPNHMTAYGYAKEYARNKKVYIYEVQPVDEPIPGLRNSEMKCDRAVIVGEWSIERMREIRAAQATSA